MSKQCSNCHAVIDDTMAICPFCGTQQVTETVWSDNADQQNPVPTAARSGKGPYLSSAAQGLLVALAVLCFLSSSATLGLLLLGSIVGQLIGGLDLFEAYGETLPMLTEFFLPILLAAIADAAFYVVFGILLLVKKSWKIALTITVYSSLWFVLGLVNGAASGIPLLPVIGVLCTIWLRKAPDGNG